MSALERAIDQAIKLLEEARKQLTDSREGRGAA